MIVKLQTSPNNYFQNIADQIKDTEKTSQNDPGTPINTNNIDARIGALDVTEEAALRTALLHPYSVVPVGLYTTQDTYNRHAQRTAVWYENNTKYLWLCGASGSYAPKGGANSVVNSNKVAAYIPSGIIIDATNARTAPFCASQAANQPSNFDIYTSEESQPETWTQYFAYYTTAKQATVHYGVSLEEFLDIAEDDE